MHFWSFSAHRQRSMRTNRQFPDRSWPTIFGRKTQGVNNSVVSCDVGMIGYLWRVELSFFPEWSDRSKALWTTVIFLTAKTGGQHFMDRETGRFTRIWMIKACSGCYTSRFSSIFQVPCISSSVEQSFMLLPHPPIFPLLETYNFHFETLQPQK